MLSDCCGAMVRFQDICSRCGEHCEIMTDSEREYNAMDDILWARYPLDSDDGYDAARDAYNEGYGPPVTSRQRREEQEEYDEYRRSRYY